eukprot:TRINITY_DN3699_c0_g1_i1.p1 TRINITY_DN3699_c0_g1~~TRINITY_DN3699_c0_g1_i1.p1  ORF type:complete len:153 (+),score=6.99 TRINITY_DN3699_c0_g1_i1:169-627(+)
MGIHFFLLISRHGKVRLSKWYVPMSAKERQRAIREISSLVIGRQSKLCNFLEWNDRKIVWKRYASLYFLTAVDNDDNELLHLEVIHHFVECLDSYFGNVCELDLIYNFHKAYYLLNAVILNGELHEPSRRAALAAVNAQEALIPQEVADRLE